MSTFDPKAVKAIFAELVDDYSRQLTAEFVLGKKGEHFDGEEWERRADQWHYRCKAAESMVGADLKRGTEET